MFNPKSICSIKHQSNRWYSLTQNNQTPIKNTKICKYLIVFNYYLLKRAKEENFKANGGLFPPVNTPWLRRWYPATREPSGLILGTEGMGAIVHKKGKNMMKKGKICQFLGKFWRNCTKFNNIFQKGSLLRAIMARNK